MTNELKKNSLSIFEQIRKTDDSGNEYWSGREMAKVLEYSEYRHFLPVIEKAKEACKNSGQRVADHIEDILDMIETGKTARREVESVKLSRYACYLIVQNADPAKEVVALGQAAESIRKVEKAGSPKRLNTKSQK